MSLPSLHAPREHGQILAAPSFDQAGTLLANNLRNLSSATLLGTSLHDLRIRARREILEASAAYHREAGDLSPLPLGERPGVRADLSAIERDSPHPQPVSQRERGEETAWLVAGHQPELFHPGVWFKNFALNQLAHKHRALPINLIVDTDEAKPALLHAPAGPHLARVAYDRSTNEAPYEERAVIEESTFARLPEALAPIIQHWNFTPMLPTFWTEVMRQARRTPLLGERFAAARRAMERRWGCVQHEVPMSRVCATEAFAWFACAILSDLPAFHERYNQTVQQYRVAHGIRSHSHPVPDLARDGAWLETPFWAWRTGQARRGRLFAQPTKEGWNLRVGADTFPSVPRADAVAAWRDLQTRGFKVRSRALTTTMFARLFLADVFLHGIGGGIYDELTDHLIESCFGIPAPGFMILSATLLLPLPRYPESASRLRELGHRLRDLTYKPELFVEPSETTRAKQAWIARSCATHAERVERFHRIRELNARMQPEVTAIRQAVEADLRVQGEHVQVDAVAGRRDYAFCLYPEEMLREFFTRPLP